MEMESYLQYFLSSLVVFTEQPNDCRLTTGVDFVSIIIKNDNKKAHKFYIIDHIW